MGGLGSANTEKIPNEGFFAVFFNFDLAWVGGVWREYTVFLLKVSEGGSWHPASPGAYSDSVTEFSSEQDVLETMDVQ